MLMDYHIHTDTSSDSRTTIRDVYEIARAKGIKYVCINSHHEPSELKNGDFRQSLTEETIQKTKKEISKLNKNGAVKIMQSVEMSYIETEETYIKEFIDKHEFDMVMGTLHYVYNLPLGNPRLEGKIDIPASDVYAEYFRLTKKMITSGLFDVIAHPDLPKRVIPEADIEENREEWEKIGALLAEHGVGFEVNTSYARKVEGGTYPDPKIIRIFLDKGAKIITIGSDAHRPEEIGREIDQAQEMLKALGVKEVYRFEKRKAIPMKL